MKPLITQTHSKHFPLESRLCVCMYVHIFKGMDGFCTSMFLFLVDLPSSGYTLDVDEIWVAADGPNYPISKSFLGNMQNFYYNDKKFFEYLENGIVSCISFLSPITSAKFDYNLLPHFSIFIKKYLMMPSCCLFTDL